MNYYQILHIDKNSTCREIKKHYYQLAKKYHPDKNNNNSQKCEDFKLLSEAYSTLSNPKKRYLYDLELLLKEYSFLNDSFQFQFNDEELILIHEYYSKFINSTEIRFLKIIYQSLPQHIKNKLKQKINIFHKNFTLIHTKNLKYIDISQIKYNYNIHLKRNLKDVFLNLSKQIIITTQNNIYHLFITHSDYSITILNHLKSTITLSIETQSDHYHINQYDLYLNQKINLYQYYFEDQFSIQLPNQKLYHYKNQNQLNTYTLHNYGLKNPNTNRRGNLYIHHELNLNIPNIHHYKNDIHKIFNN